MGDQAGRIGWGSTFAAAQHALPVRDLNADGSRGAGDGGIDQAGEVVVVRGGDAGMADMEAVARARDAKGDARAFGARDWGAARSSCVRLDYAGQANRAVRAMLVPNDRQISAKRHGR